MPQLDIDTPAPIRTAPEARTQGPGSSTKIAATLRRAILEGNYGFNERLPAERQLADQFGASRGTIREALRQLEEAGLVSRRVGSGTFVQHRDLYEQANVAKAISPLELIDVRFGIEPFVVRLAVANATNQDIERLQAALHKVEEAENPEEFSIHDSAFHQALADATRNPLMQWLYTHLNDVRGHTQWSAVKGKILTVGRIEKYNRQHRALFKAIRVRDVDAAVDAINQHLILARQHLIGQQSPARRPGS